VGDCRNPAHHFDVEFLFVRQQWCEVYISTETDNPGTFSLHFQRFTFSLHFQRFTHHCVDVRVRIDAP